MGIEKTKDGILNFRNRKHLNQTELAKILKIKPANVSKWESGKNNFPSFKAAEQLLEMGITVEELFGIEYNKMHNLGGQGALPIGSDANHKQTLKKLNDFEADLLREVLNEYASFDGELESIKNLKELYKLEREIERGDKTTDLAAKKQRLQELQEQIENKIPWSDMFYEREYIKSLEVELEEIEEAERNNSYDKSYVKRHILESQKEIEKDMYSYVDEELKKLEQQESTREKVIKWNEKRLQELNEKIKQLQIEPGITTKIRQE